MTSAGRLGLAALSVALVAACREERGIVGPSAAPASSSSGTKPVDRLAPGELAPGELVVFGMHVPRGMTLERKYADTAHITGRVKPEDVANYVRERVITDRVEIGAARTVFPRARIKGDLNALTYRIEVVPSGPETKLVIRDLTREPAEPGLSEAERWRKAGFTADGKPLDPKSME